ncbi:MAG: acyl-CoA dehydrogenase [Oligoflexia bacterium]|nr:acyl-CoA dehydrogenase [Oligoflexia bacterium]
MANAHLWGGWIPLKKYLSPSSSKLFNKKPILALAATEPKTGSDFFGMNTLAKKSRNGWILNGEKTLVTNGTICDHFLVFAKTKHSRDPRELSCFLLDANVSGIKKAEVKKRIGLERTSLANIQFKNVFVPNANIIGDYSLGGEIFQYAMTWERSLIFSYVPSLLEKLSNQILKLAKKRKRTNKAISEHPLFIKKRERIHTIAEDIRELISISATKLDNKENAFFSAIKTKVQVSQKYEEASRLLLQLDGKNSFLHESPFEENFYNSIASSLYSGPNDLLQMVLDEISI